MSVPVKNSCRRLDCSVVEPLTLGLRMRPSCTRFLVKANVAFVEVPYLSVYRGLRLSIFQMWLQVADCLEISH